ncbi:MAG: cytochrome c peroxidase [Bacteroidota bacterium]
MRYGKYIGVLIFIVVLIGCVKDGPLVGPLREELQLEVPEHFERPRIPESNPLTEAKVQLGRQLFYDPILSMDNTVSCASCHPQEHAFSDPRRISVGVGGKTGILPEQRRNAPALFNLMYHDFLFWDGRIEDPFGTLEHMEAQIRLPIEDPNEMGSSFKLVMERLNDHPEYPKLFLQAFDDTITELRIMQAIASFERVLLSYSSKYDRFVEAGFDSTVLTSAEYRGFKLFFDEVPGRKHPECFHCHGGFNFDDPAGTFRNNGLDRNGGILDAGRFQVTANTFDFGKFKVPSLRNVSFTAPYMHDGRFETLDEVLDFYQTGGNPSTGLDPLMTTIGFTDEEKADLKSFLLTLNDTSFVTNPDFASPF